MKKNKEKNTMSLCFKYAANCKYCPRNMKCDKEYEKEQSKSKSMVRKR